LHERKLAIERLARLLQGNIGSRFAGSAMQDRQLPEMLDHLVQRWQIPSVDWSARESVQAKLRLMVKRILRKYKYPPDHQDAAVELVLEQVQAFGEGWGG
jgi:type I restriction enzyme R subunit